ncbi:mitochondrial carrier [Ophiobolus disseminans]|uniref:Mitochondrial carrier n=1 Tax=Ophiobolus disseminans TaxID=1469910 RepID=A0A6A7ADT9_9PLEO|nr:mitochondrial carrier [Ophiobolus disseminans]
MVSGGKDKNTPAFVSLAAGGIAGGVEGFISYPLEFAKTRVQLREKKGVLTPRNPFVVVQQVYQKEGIRAVYKGCGPLVIGSIGKDAVRFLFFDQIKEAFADPTTGTLSPVRNLLAGMTAGVAASVTAVTPSERIKTAMIDDARHEKRFRSGWHATSTIWKEQGIVGLYRGLAGSTLKQASATAFRMGTYNVLKDYQKRRDIKQSTAINFANGSVAGVVTTLTTQPFDVIKTRSQSALGMTTAESTKSILIDYGLRGFWKGTTMRLGRTVFSGGILFTSYEAAVKLIMPLYGGHGNFLY